jgi:hypothetical protein
MMIKSQETKRGAFIALAAVLMLSAAPLAAPAFAQGAPAAGAQNAPAQQGGEFQQIKLSEPQVKGFIAAQKEINGIQGIAEKLQASQDKPDPGLQKQLEDIAKKNGFKDFAELDDVAANVSIVLTGLDPQTGEYSDPVDLIKKEMEDVKADASIPEKDKKQTLDEMADALKNTPPLKYKENVTLVKKYQKDIEKALEP